MPSFAIGPYLAPYASTLRPCAYYATWGAYYASFLVQPGLITLLQLLVLLLTWFLPPLERWTERSRARMRQSDWADERWAWAHNGGRRPPTEYPEWLKNAGRAVDYRWAFVAAWLWVQEQMRAVSRWMGWDKGVSAVKGKKKDAAAPRAQPPSIRLPSHPPVPAPAAASPPAPRPPSHHSHSSPTVLAASHHSHRSHHSLQSIPLSPVAPSNAPSARSNPFSTPPIPLSRLAQAHEQRPPTLRSRSAALGAGSGSHVRQASARSFTAPLGQAVGPGASGWGAQGGGAGSVFSRASNPFSAGARSPPLAQQHHAEDDGGRGSVWTGRGSGWRRA